MKRQILSSLALVGATIGFGQLIPNGDFESWETALSYEEPVYKAFTSSIAVHMFQNNVPGLSKIMMNGSNAMKLENINGVASFGIFGKLNENQTGITETENFPVPIRPTGFKFDAEFDLAAGDTATIVAILNATVLGTPYSLPFIAKVTGKSNGVTTITMPFVYNPQIVALDGKATSFGIAVLSNIENNTALGNGFVTVDNFDFVNTMGASMYKPSYGTLENWTLTEQAQPAGWSTIAEYLVSNAVVKKTTGAIEGATSLELNTIINPYSPTETITGVAVLGTYNPNDDIEPSIKLEDEYDKVSISYTHSGCGTLDSANFIMIGFKTGLGEVGGNSVKLSNTNGVVKDTIIDLFFITMPDSAAFILTSGRENFSTIGCKLVVDDIQLIKKVAVGLAKNNATSSSLYPNPSNGTVTLAQDAATIKVYTMAGTQVLEQHVSGQNKLNLNSGMYIYELFDAQNQLIEKQKMIID